MTWDLNNKKKNIKIHTPINEFNLWKFPRYISNLRNFNKRTLKVHWVRIESNMIRLVFLVSNSKSDTIKKKQNLNANLNSI